MLFSQTAVAAGLLVLPLAAANPVKRGSFKFPLERRATDDTSLDTIYSNTDWIVKVSLGGQDFHLQVDTGSSNTWVLSNLMPEDKRRQFPSNKFYDPTKSKSYKEMDGSSFNITYGALGGIYGAGKVATEDITIGTSTINMEIGFADDCSPVGMVDTNYDGMMGLAFGAGNTFKPTAGLTFAEALQSQLDEPVFTFNVPGSSKSHQMMEFGHVDKNLYTGNLATAAIHNGTAGSSKGWLATAQYSVNGKMISSNKNQVLFDTGGIAGTADKDTVKAYWDTVKGAKDTAGDGTGWAAPCSGPMTDLTYEFDAPDGSTAKATVPGKMLLSTDPLPDDSSMCSGAFQAALGSGKGNVGYGFFHSQFTVFNQRDATVSFAPYSNSAMDGTTPSDSSSASGSSSSSGSAPSTTISSPPTKPTVTGSGSKPTDASNSTSTAVTGSAPSVSAAVPASAPSASDAAPGGSGNGNGAGNAASADSTKKSLAAGKIQPTTGTVLMALAAVAGLYCL